MFRSIIEMKHKKKKYIIILLVILLLSAGVYLTWYLTGGFLSAATMQIADEDYIEGNVRYVRREEYSSLSRGILPELPEPDENMGLDLRGTNVSGIDLTGESDILKRVTFDTHTVWPDDLPDGFSPEEIMENGKNPGFDIRELHKKGITGEGISIAIVDQALNPGHTEYADNLMSYELLHCSDNAAQMHGSAVTSIAVGKSCGVAPGAKIYYIASTFGTYGFGKMKMDLNYMADSIDRILEVNKLLPKERKIRVISISRGFTSEKGADEVRAAIERAKDAGVFVITTATEDNYGFSLMGLGKEQMTDPDDVSVYGPGHFWSDSFYNGGMTDSSRMLLVPMDARTYASWYDSDGYEFASSGGLSWSVPWLAGMYALCLQADNELTPEEFIEKAFETGTVQTIEYQGKQYELGTVIDPAALIEAL